jgi:hypothetical protein
MMGYLSLGSGLTVTRSVSTMFVAGEMYLSGSQLVFLFGCILLFVSAAAHHNNEKHQLLLDDHDGTGRQLANLESTQQ